VPGVVRCKVNLPYQNPFLPKLALLVVLGTYLIAARSRVSIPVANKTFEEDILEVEKLLQRLGLARHNESDDMHKKVGERVSVQHDTEDSLHGFDFCLIAPFFEGSLEAVYQYPAAQSWIYMCDCYVL
jgi:hypothetical protein